MMKRLSEVRTDFVLSRNHLRALTGHTFLSSEMVDMDEMFGRKISPGEKEMVSFLVKKAGSGSRKTPSLLNLMKPSLVVRA